jgi:hypothetical protein
MKMRIVDLIVYTRIMPRHHHNEQKVAIYTNQTDIPVSARIAAAMLRCRAIPTPLPPTVQFHLTGQAAPLAMPDGGSPPRCCFRVYCQAGCYCQYDHTTAEREYFAKHNGKGKWRAGIILCINDHFCRDPACQYLHPGQKPFCPICEDSSHPHYKCPQV